MENQDMLDTSWDDDELGDGEDPSNTTDYMTLDEYQMDSKNESM